MWYLFSCALLNSYIYVILDSDGNKGLIMHDQHTLLRFIIILLLLLLLLLLSKYFQ